MTTGTCPGELWQRLAEAGFAAEAPELGAAWPAWRNWAAIGVTFTRQFRHCDADGEFSHFERIGLSLGQGDL